MSDSEKEAQRIISVEERMTDIQRKAVMQT